MTCSAAPLEHNGARVPDPDPLLQRAVQRMGSTTPSKPGGPATPASAGAGESPGAGGIGTTGRPERKHRRKVPEQFHSKGQCMELLGLVVCTLGFVCGKPAGVFQSASANKHHRKSSEAWGLYYERQREENWRQNMNLIKILDPIRLQRERSPGPGAAAGRSDSSLLLIT